MQGATFSGQGAVFRKLKTGLFIFRDSHWCAESQHQHAGSAFYSFTFLLFKITFLPFKAFFTFKILLPKRE